jgi:hypothetical protein
LKGRESTSFDLDHLLLKISAKKSAYLGLKGGWVFVGGAFQANAEGVKETSVFCLAHWGLREAWRAGSVPLQRIPSRPLWHRIISPLRPVSKEKTWEKHLYLVALSGLSDPISFLQPGTTPRQYFRRVGAFCIKKSRHKAGRVQRAAGAANRLFLKFVLTPDLYSGV